MAITWPSALVDPVMVEIGIMANTQVHVSELSGELQTVELPGARWTMNLSMAPLKRSGEAALLEAFIAKLRGQAVRATMPVFGRRTPLGAWAGAAAVNNEVGSPTVPQTGSSIEVNGLTSGTTIKAGDYFNFGSGGELHMVTEDTTADGSGRATISFQPPIRTSPPHGTLLVTTNPVVPLMILTDPHARWGIKPADITDFSLSLVEVFS